MAPSGRRRFCSYHLYLRTGTSPTEDFINKTWFLPNVKLYGLHAQRKAEDEGLVWYYEGLRCGLIAAAIAVAK